MKRLSGALGAGALFAAASAIAAPPADLDARVKHDMELYGVPGMAVAVVEDGKVVHAKGYGIREINKAAKVDEHTIFPIASCSKAFTAAALAILVDDGKLSWDDKVIDKLPGFRMYDPFTSSEMTVRDLLVHRSGLGLGAGDMLWMGGTDYTRKQLVERLRFIKPATSFRSGYAYDNVLYIAAGQLIEAVSGLTWEEFLAKRIFKPLGMKDTVDSERDAMKSSNHVSLHARLGGVMRGVGGTMQVLPKESGSVEHNAAPAGAINASAVDMARWMQVQLAHGAMPDGKRLFSEAQAKEMWTPAVIEPEGKVPPSLADAKPNLTAYALGWNVTDYRGHKIVTHTGAVFGGLAIVMLLPEKNVGVAAISRPPPI
jgi:CubicO group peptidase (beta-lactamase class C family)